MLAVDQAKTGRFNEEASRTPWRILIPMPGRKPPANDRHVWEFRPRFRAKAYSWKGSALGSQRLKAAVSEIQKVGRTDPTLAPEGAILLIERISPAFEQIDSSSGAIGSAVNHALDTLVPLIVGAQVDEPVRRKWLDRLWAAFEADEIPYIEALGDRWGELCVTPTLTNEWADRLVDPLKWTWRRNTPGSYFQGSSAALSCLLSAQRYDELLALLELAPFPWAHYRRFGALALAAQGQVDEAVAYLSNCDNDSYGRHGRAGTCEAILLAAGRWETAYRDWAITANFGNTRLDTFRTIKRKYPEVPPDQILRDLVASLPGDEGKWFATAKCVGLYDLAIELANRSPADPQTLIRAARDFEAKAPAFAIDAGVAAIRWIAQGYGYEITSADVLAAYRHATQAAEALGEGVAVRQRIGALLEQKGPASNWVRSLLAPALTGGR